MIINGYIQPLMNEYSRSSALYNLGVLCKDYRSYFASVTESITYHVASKGRRIMGTLIELRHKEYPPLTAKAA